VRSSRSGRGTGGGALRVAVPGPLECAGVGPHRTDDPIHHPAPLLLIGGGNAEGLERDGAEDERHAQVREGRCGECRVEPTFLGLPIVFVYYAVYALVASGVMWLVFKALWPSEDDDGSRDDVAREA
jgi:hypothetical protein